MSNNFNIKMEFPTWETIALKLGTFNTEINPSETYGDIPFNYNIKDNPLLTCKGTYDKDLVGIDIPVMLRQKNTDNIIVILGQAPLRNNKDKDPNDNIVFGTPYAVHLNKNYPSSCKVYKTIFDGLLNKNYSVYLTDIIKDWWKDRKWNPSEKEVEILKTELELLQKKYNPKNIIIVTFGEIAKDAINKLNLPYKQINLLHPSKANWHNWKIQIFEEALYSNNINYALSKYPKRNSPTTEKIVAETALQFIYNEI